MTDPTTRKPTVYSGILGWANMRAGVEFYPLGEGRHARDHSARLGRDPRWGHLLVDDIDPAMVKEGSRVLVVVMPSRFAGAEQVHDRIIEALTDD